MSFWIIAGLMTAAALAVVLLPLWRTRTSVRDRRAENLDIYRRRLRELEDEVREGILPPEEVEATRAELEKRLLEDIEGDPGEIPESGAGGTGRRRPARWAVFWSILVVLPLGAAGLYAVLGVSPAEQARIGAAGGERPGADMPELVAGLAQRLREDPDNGEGWALLGRSYLFLEQPGRAAEAFAKARALLGDSPDLLVDYANALAMRSGGDFQGRADRLLQKALEQAPDDPRALWLAGLAAAQRGEPGQAGVHWRRLLQQLDPDSEDAVTIRRQLAQLDGATAEMSVAAAAAGEGPPATPPAAGITVEVSFAPAIASRAAPEDSVFIFARAADGPPAPLAAVRRRVADLPLTVRLDEADAMMPGRSLADADRIVVGARVSRSGDPIPRSGDLQGMSGALRAADTGEVRVVIDSVVP